MQEQQLCFLKNTSHLCQQSLGLGLREGGREQRVYLAVTLQFLRKGTHGPFPENCSVRFVKQNRKLGFKCGA